MHAEHIADLRAAAIRARGDWRAGFDLAWRLGLDPDISEDEARALLALSRDDG